ncbi:MAG TPA: bifunctional nuclease family protein [Candidatus Saccharimonadales bacterium]|nr:bifunctional nuclease family protein [Candidatus Saccharimonadales bacterium]
MADDRIVEVKISGLAIDDRTKSPVVILKEADGERVLPIWIGENEAKAIALELAGKKFTRPLTHDLMMSIIEGLHARVERVVISDLRDNTFFAVVLLQRDSEFASIDARPSDSIALALRARANIYVSDALLNQEGPAQAARGLRSEQPQTDEQRAEELRRYLENLDPEDFGKFNP